MWIWLMISMLLVVACIIFGIYSFISSRTLQKSIAAGPECKVDDKHVLFNRNALTVVPRQPIVNLKTKLKSIEENSLRSAHHLHELKKRIQALENTGVNRVNEQAAWDDSGEDWEKLYYEVKREKQSFEDNLNSIKDAFKESTGNLQALEKHQAAMRSDVESGINEIHSLQNVIEELQRKVEGGIQREKELAHELSYAESKLNAYELSRNENSQLRSEIDTLTNRLEEIGKQNLLVEDKIKNLAKLGSISEISSYGKKGYKQSY